MMLFEHLKITDVADDAERQKTEQEARANKNSPALIFIQWKLVSQNATQ